MRRKPAHAPARMLSLDELMPSDEQIGLLLQDGGLGPELSLLDSEQHRLLHQATLRIPAPLRIVLVLHDMEELTTRQVAQILDLQQGTVRIRLHRARLTVRKEMKQLLDGATGNSDRAESSTKTPGARRSRSKKRPDECRDLFANLSEYMDGKLEPVSCEQMRTHIEACPSCVAFLRDLRAAIDRCRSLEMPCNSDISPRLRSMLTREYLRMLVVPAAK
jgi:RNA polymerase sigma-70 factor (ECF subfamily)